MRKTIPQLLQLASRQINNLDAELILSHILGEPREYILSHPEKNVDLLTQLKFKKFLKKRANNIPLAYITGHKEFFGLDFVVNKHTLIPRPDTEILVEEAIKTINRQPTTGKTLLVDIGTGSGCIPISILKTIKTFRTSRTFTAFAIDISKKALKVAKRNAKKHNVDITFLHGNLLKALISHKHLNTQILKHIFITANLPYLTEEQYNSEPSIQHEPKSALIAKDGGLELYKKLLQQIKQLSTTYNLQPTTYLEIDPSQKQKIITLIKEIWPNIQVEINPAPLFLKKKWCWVKKDLAGQDRVVVLKIDN